MLKSLVAKAMRMIDNGYVYWSLFSQLHSFVLNYLQPYRSLKGEEQRCKYCFLILAILPVQLRTPRSAIANAHKSHIVLWKAFQEQWVPLQCFIKQQWICILFVCCSLFFSVCKWVLYQSNVLARTIATHLCCWSSSEVFKSCYSTCKYLHRAKRKHKHAYHIIEKWINVLIWKTLWREFLNIWT